MILVVDDEKGVRDLVRRLLERAGHQVAEAGSAAEALEYLRGESEAPLLMLTDIVMPGMNGLQLAAQVHVMRPEMPVIFMSGFATQYRDELSGTVCLAKPFKASELLAAIEGAVRNPRRG